MTSSCARFVGNWRTLKATEGVAAMIVDFLDRVHKALLQAKFAAIVSYPVLNALEKLWIIVGYKGAAIARQSRVLVFKGGHGSADEVAFGHCP